mgnify:CR=1 FL=1
MSAKFPAGVLSGDQLQKLLAYAKQKGFAIPAINVTCTDNTNAVMEAARDFIYRTLIPRMSEDMALEPENPKSALQERLQEDGITPTYKLVETQGPPHDRTFVAQVFAGNQGLARGTGRTKKEAESQAAKFTLSRLGEFFGLGMDEQARAEKAAAAKQAKADKAAARAEEKARKKHERELHKSMKQG